MLLTYRKEHPEMKQLILRPGIILGSKTKNQITDLFEKMFVLGIRGSDMPFVFIWDMDVVNIIIKGIIEENEGIYNLSGDGIVTMKQIAQKLGKPYIEIPAWLFKTALLFLKKLRLTQYGPEQLNFLRYRPVLANDRLKSQFGYAPTLTSEEVFDFYLRSKC